jgi:hypothetical protein
VNRLGAGPAALSLGAHQAVEQHPARVVQDADLEDLVGEGIESGGLQLKEDGANRSALSGCGPAWPEALQQLSKLGLPAWAASEPHASVDVFV